MEIAVTKDVLQEETGLGRPEIRVWCHPHKIGENGSDTYEVFDSFKDAEYFIKSHKDAEETPLVAFGGYEIDLWSLLED